MTNTSKIKKERLKNDSVAIEAEKVGVSLIIPCYKRVQQTLRTTRLVLQSRGIGEEFDLEVIIADCTPDDSLEKAVKRTFGKKVLYTKTKKRGLATNKNQGAKVAKHELIIFCDSDVEVEKDTVANTVHALRMNPRAGGVGGTTIWRGGPKDGSQDRPEKEDRHFKAHGTTYSEVLYGRYFGTYKTVWEDAGHYDEVVFNLLGESSDMSTRIWRAGYPLIYDPSIRMFHCHNAPESLATRVEHPEYTIVRNWFLLMYKFDMFAGERKHFTQHINSYLDTLGAQKHLSMLTGFGKFSDEIAEAIAHFKTQKQLSPKYDFKFLEVFSDETLLHRCLEAAERRLRSIRKRVGFN